MATQMHEVLAWLGDDHGLSADELGELMAEMDSIDARYPDLDDEDEREAARITAYRLIAGHVDCVLVEQAQKLLRARSDEVAALAALRQAAVQLIPGGAYTEAGFAREAGVDRMAVRTWLGKR